MYRYCLIQAEVISAWSGGGVGGGVHCTLQCTITSLLGSSDFGTPKYRYFKQI
jgi:hypothetical protein